MLRKNIRHVLKTIKNYNKKFRSYKLSYQPQKLRKKKYFYGGTFDKIYS